MIMIELLYENSLAVVFKYKFNFNLARKATSGFLDICCSRRVARPSFTFSGKVAKQRKGGAHLVFLTRFAKSNRFITITVFVKVREEWKKETTIRGSLKA